MAGGQVHFGQLQIADDASQDVVEIVRDATRQRAQRLHFLRLQQLFLQLPALLLGVLLVGDVLVSHP